MDAILHALTTGILPIFAVAGLGYAAGLAGMTREAEARAINGLVVRVFLPALTILLLANTSWDALDHRITLVVIGLELALAAAAFLVIRFWYRLPAREAILLGVGASFVNHVFFVLPIAVALYGPEAQAPIAVIVAIDMTLLLGGSMLILDLMSPSGGGALAAVKRVATNPPILAIAAGIAVNQAGIGLSEGVETFLRFAGNAAAPASLFALGVVLAWQPIGRFSRVAAFVTAMKLVAHPVLFIFLVSELAPGGRGGAEALLVAAGPCASSSFALALHYGIDSRRISAATIYSTVASLATLALFA